MWSGSSGRTWSNWASAAAGVPVAAKRRPSTSDNRGAGCFVLDDHLLITPRAFEPQEALLTPEDFAALWSCMGGAPVLGFYNGGVTAGASQPHKHLQLIRLPVGDPASRGPPVPTATLLAAGQLPFQVAHARLDLSFETSAVTLDEVLKRLGVSGLGVFDELAGLVLCSHLSSHVTQ